jgi:hypothetical protein
LRDHLLARLLGLEYNGDEHNFSDEQRGSITIAKNRMYLHSTFRLNYTTYDLRREQDSINPRTHPDIMMLAHEDDEDPHPFWYARVQCVFHVVVRHDSLPVERKMEVLWVRWFGRDLSHAAGWAPRRLHRIGFVPDRSASPAFGFVDPSHVIRAVHLIPAFAHGKTEDYLGPSLVRSGHEHKDWAYYYVAM